VKPENTAKPTSPFRAGAALDIGTTTVQVQLVNLGTGDIIDTLSALNAQRVFGADVMTRISFAQKGKLNELFTAINSQVNEMLRFFISKWNLQGIEKCAVSGNTTMLHLFCNVDPSSMGAAPYTPVFLDERNFRGEELSLPAQQITLLPGISAFIGADVTAGLALIDMKENSLFVDIGTNGEIVLKEKHFLCCSAAAGPCFEEAEISCGLNAAEFINAIADMKRTAIIDETGALSDMYTAGFPVKEGCIITQKDIRQFQLAKSAIYSAIKTLVKMKKIDIVYIAGGLGLHLNLENAAEIGLFPKEFVSTKVCGNTSLGGAVQSLLSPSFLQNCRDIISNAEVIDLAASKYFSASFAANMEI